MLFQNGNQRHQTGGSILEAPQRAGSNYIKTHQPIKDDLDFDLNLDSGQNSGLGLSLDLNLGLDQESELEPESELESEIQTRSDLETELETDAQTEPEMEEEPEPEPEPESEKERRPQPRTRIRAHSPWRNYFTAYRFGSSSSQSRIPSQTPSVEKKQPRAHPNSPHGDEDTW